MPELRKGLAPEAGAASTGFVVTDIDATIARLEQEGGRIGVPIHNNEEHGAEPQSPAIPKDILIELIRMVAPR